LQTTEVQSQQDRSTIQNLRDDLKTSNIAEQVAASKHEQSLERIAALESELARFSKTLSASEEKWDRSHFSHLHLTSEQDEPNEQAL
jgi:hypothetical protein